MCFLSHAEDPSLSHYSLAQIWESRRESQHSQRTRFMTGGMSALGLRAYSHVYISNNDTIIYTWWIGKLIDRNAKIRSLWLAVTIN